MPYHQPANQWKEDTMHSNWATCSGPNSVQIGGTPLYNAYLAIYGVCSRVCLQPWTHGQPSMITAARPIAGEIIAFFYLLHSWVFFLSCNFLSHIDEYIEPMATIKTWVKILYIRLSIFCSMQPGSAVRLAVHLLQTQDEVHPGQHSNVCNFFAICHCRLLVKRGTKYIYGWLLII